MAFRQGQARIVADTAQQSDADLVEGRPALEGLNGTAAPDQRAHQPQSDSRLARARPYGGDDETARAHRQPTRPASSCRRSPAMAPITTMAGEPMPCARASATNFDSV